jgi:two-component system NtrC family sensor kinase
LTPLILLAAYFHFAYGATLRQGIDSHLQSIAENQRNTIDLFLRERVVNVVNRFPAEPVSLPPSAAAMDELLAGLRNESSTFVDVGLFDPNGRLVAYAGPHASLLGKDYSAEPWFARVRESASHSYISDVYLGFRDKPHFIVAVSRSRPDGPWVLRASVDPERFTEFVGRCNLMADASTAIVNAAGQRQTTRSADGVPGSLPFVPSRESGTRIVEMSIDGQGHLVAFAWLSEVDWALAVELPTGKAFAPLWRARLILGLIVLGAVGLIVLFVRRSTDRLVAELERADAAREDLKWQLFNAAKLASVGEMSAGVAHEINNPLAIIYEEASMLKDLLDPELGGQLDRAELLERLGAITDATMRGRAITSKLMAFARRHDPEPEPTDVNELVQQVLALKKNDFNVSSIAIERAFDGELPPVVVNRNQIEQVLLNLLNNARDAIEGAGRVTVCTRLEGRFVAIEVEDSGCGMTAAQLEKVFFPFYTTKPVGKGTGLGLSISYGIIKSHGGRIEVESEVGKGTKFTLLLPTSRRAATTEPRAAESADEDEPAAFGD